MQPYNLTRILTPGVTLDMAAFESYSPLFMSYVPLLGALRGALSEIFSGRASPYHMGMSTFLPYFIRLTLTTRLSFATITGNYVLFMHENRI